MRLLLDTHALIWWDEGTGLTREAIEAIRSADQVYVSAVSGLEIAIKASLGKIVTKRSVAEALDDSGFEELPMLLRHAERLAGLPHHHRDPFDRMLIAQALVERLTIVTRDSAFKRYRVSQIEA